MKLAIFQKISDPGYAKKFKKWPSLTKSLFSSKQPEKS